MPDYRFFSESDLTIGSHPDLEKDELHHLNRVMRATVGDDIEVVNGRGVLARCRVCDRDRVEVVEITHASNKRQQTALALAISKPSHLELVVQKGTELGINHFYLFAGDRSEKKEVNANGQRRLLQILRGGIKQCGRLDLPLLTFCKKIESVPLEGWLPFFGDLHAKATTTEKVDGNPLLFIGPESGFSEREQLYLQEKTQGILLHKNVLRCETAAIVGAYCLGMMTAQGV